MSNLRRDPRLDTRRHTHTWRVVDLRTGASSRWAPWKDWRQVARAMRGVEKRMRGVKT